MPVKEESFRIGCGRYIQGKGYTSRIGDEIKRLGKSALIIGGKTALAITGEKIEKSLSGKACTYEMIVHEGSCNDEDAKRLAALSDEKGYEVITGVGGGVICDFAKLVGYYAKKPVINIPTSSATCAAYTPLSVRYTPEGKTVGSLHYDYEVSAVVADTEVIAAQPTRLFLSGVFDALAKFVEIKQRYREEAQSYPMGLDYAYAMSVRSYKMLNEKADKCIDDMKKGEITEDVENIIFTAVAATGVISGIARGSNQTALAHKFYETVRYFYPERSKPYLHGEIVGIGLLLQNFFNGEEQNNTSLLELMKKHSMPYCLKDIEVENNENNLNLFYERMSASSAIESGSYDECKRLKEALLYLWSLE